MKSSREFMPGDDVEVMFPPAESEEGNTAFATVVSRIHDGKVEVEFKNGKKALMQVGDLSRINR